MKEPITKFDFEAAFKALDEIDIPKAGKVRANKPALTEIFSRKTKFDALMEEYYDIGSNEGLEDAKEAREAEVAQAKLARIEKIVDLDADSAEDLLTSYVGKFIMQCPQCMTLFYKNEEDVVASEDDPSTVNVNEVCQHCGNESGYSLVGKVGEAEPEAPAEETPAEDIELDAEEPTEEGTEAGAEESSEEADLESLEAELMDLDLEEPAEEEEKKEESFTAHAGEALVEELADDKDLDDKLKAHNEYIEYLRAAIDQEEAKLEKATNEQVKAAIQRNIDAFKADLESALPDAVKNDVAIETEPVEEPVEEPAEEPAEEETAEDADVHEESTEEESTEAEPTNESLTEGLHEDSSENFEKLMSSDEFQKPISDAEVKAILAASNDEEPKEESLDNVFSDVDELQEDDLESMISDSLVEMYKNVASFKLTDCTYADNKFMVEGVINFKSGKTRNTTYTFNEAFVKADKITLRGLNEKLGIDKHFYIAGRAENKTFITESIKITKD